MIENWQPQSDFMKRLDARARAESARTLLLRQLRRRFGSIDPTTEQKLAAASEEELGRWAENLVFADSLEAVFAD